MTHVLIVYATREGQTERIARRIAQTITSEGHTAELLDTDRRAGSVDLSRFGRVVIGGPIHVQGYPRSIVRFARSHLEELRHMPNAFFSVGLAIASRTSDGRGQTLEVVEKFVKKTGWRPGHVELIAGALPYSKYNFLVRFVMRRIAAAEGGDTDTSRDYEYTDWDAVQRFARELVASGAEAGAYQPSPDGANVMGTLEPNIPAQDHDAGGSLNRS